MSVETKVEETTNADGLQSSQPIAKPFVVSRFSSAENEERHKKVLQIMSENSCLEFREPYSKFCPPSGYKLAKDNYKGVVEGLLQQVKDSLLYRLSEQFTNENLNKTVVIQVNSYVDVLPAGQ
jgi:hypothetical protein